MEFLNCIKEIIKDSYKKTQDYLTDDKTKLNILNEKLGYLLYEFDKKGEKLFEYFKDVEGLKKICDYFLFVEYNNEPRLLLIELKQGRKSTKPQLNSSEIFAKFILEKLNFVNDNRFKYSDNTITKIKIIKLKSKKQSTKPKLNIQYDENGIMNYPPNLNFYLKTVLKNKGRKIKE